MAYPGAPHPGDQSPLVTGDAVVLDLRPAGFATRMAALIIDMVVQVVALFGAVLLVVFIGTGVDPAATAAVNLALTVLIMVGYPAAVETLTRGLSLGKVALGLRVVGVDGSPERFRQALARALASAVEIWMVPVVALTCSLVNRDGRRVGDFIAGTLVVHERAGRRPEEALPMPPHLAEWARGAELSRLSPETAGTARQYLLRFEELTEESRREMGTRIADLVAASVSPPPPPYTTPPDYLAAVLAERRRREEAKLAERRATAAPGGGPWGAGPGGGTPGGSGPDGSAPGGGDPWSAGRPANGAPGAGNTGGAAGTGGTGGRGGMGGANGFGSLPTRPSGPTAPDSDGSAHGHG